MYDLPSTSPMIPPQPSASINNFIEHASSNAAIYCHSYLRLSISSLLLFFLITFVNLGLSFMGFKSAAWNTTNPELARINRICQVARGEGREAMVGEQERERGREGGVLRAMRVAKASCPSYTEENGVGEGRMGSHAAIDPPIWYGKRGKVW